jgi:hypothetical protein
VKGSRMKDFIEKIRIQNEKQLLTYMEEVFNAPAVNVLLSFKDKQSNDRSLSSYVRGNYLPLSPQIGGRLHTISQNILHLFDLSERAVTFCIRENPEFNASAHFNFNEDEPHYIVLNSGAVDKLTEDEMRFVIGHELGHLIFAHAVFDRIIESIYSENTDTPPFLKSIYRLWVNLREMSADRVGLLAVTDFETALSAMFKMSCGLDMSRFQAKADNFMAMTDSIITDMTNMPHNFMEGTHPTNPVRVKALEVFYHSKLLQSFLSKRLYIKDKKLTQKTDELIALLQKRPADKAGYMKLDFLAAAGYYLIKSDKAIEAEEYDELMNILSNYYYWPPDYVNNLLKKTNPMKIIDKAATYIIANTPHDVWPLFNQLIPLIMKDRRIDDEEIDALLEIAEKLKLPMPEAVDALLEGIRCKYRPLS